jgi:hypothetical protein
MRNYKFAVKEGHISVVVYASSYPVALNRLGKFLVQKLPTSYQDCDIILLYNVPHQHVFDKRSAFLSDGKMYCLCGKREVLP